MNNCDLRDRKGLCKGFSPRRTCEIAKSDKSWFDERFKICETDEVCRLRSIFGNDYFVITESDIEALKNGKVLYTVDEYGTFIVFKQEEQALKERQVSNDGT